MSFPAFHSFYSLAKDGRKPVLEILRKGAPEEFSLLGMRGPDGKGVVLLCN